MRRRQGRLADAVSLFEESAAILRLIPDPWTLSYPLRELASAAASEHDYDRAERYWRESLAVLRPLDETWFVCVGLKGMAAVGFARGDYVKAGRLAAAAEALRNGGDLPAVEDKDYDFEGTVAETRAALGESSFDAVWTEGRKLSRDQAIAFALGANG